MPDIKTPTLFVIHKKINKTNLLPPLPLRVGIGFLILLCFITLPSCGDFKEVTLNGIENIKLINLSQKNVEALITVRINNPNNVSFTIYKSEMDVTLSGINAGKAHITDNVRIKAKSEESYTFKIKSDFSTLNLTDMPTLISMALSKNVKIGLKGNLNGGNFFVKHTYPVDLTQNVPLSGL